LINSRELYLLPLQIYRRVFAFLQAERRLLEPPISGLSYSFLEKEATFGLMYLKLTHLPQFTVENGQSFVGGCHKPLGYQPPFLENQM
jgi:hypothetical protein